MISETDLDLIEQYIHDKLDATQKLNVEQRLSSDEQFATQFELVKAMPTAILTDTPAFRADLHAIMTEGNQSSEPELTVPKKAKQVSLLRLFLTAAAVLAGITLAINFLSPPKNTDLYSLNFTIPAENITTRNQQEINATLSAALESYNQQNYSIAAEAFRQYLAQYPDENASRFFLAICLMQENQYEEAQTNLLRIADQTSPYQNSAHWYLALVYLKLNQIDLAKNQLAKVIAANSSYSEKAKVLLKTLS